MRTVSSRTKVEWLILQTVEFNSHWIPFHFKLCLNEYTLPKHRHKYKKTNNHFESLLLEKTLKFEIISEEFKKYEFIN